ncbi:uncharacterized protein [Apostichopus japonicus]|uniref:uncharacterized protein isoform X2 n=1 Tax=Stichopus japonicus TaxID=307972 RepID=UPI003AB2699E
MRKSNNFVRHFLLNQTSYRCMRDVSGCPVQNFTRLFNYNSIDARRLSCTSNTMFANFDVTLSFLFTVLLACNKLQPSKTQVDCNDYPCLNRGNCIHGPPDMCSCRYPLVQPFCTTSCLNTPCVNGTCVDDICNCDTNFAGPTCESAIFAYVNPVVVTVSEGNNDHDVTVQVCRQPDNTQITLQVYTSSGSASSGIDYENIPFSQDVTIPMGQVCTNETVTIRADQMFEQTEEFSLVLLIPEALQQFVYTLPGNTQTTITIMNDDPVNCDLEHPCFNGGTCRPSVLQKPCTCPAGYAEPFCTTRCRFDTCQNGGTCSNGVCSCSQGFAGPTCQSEIAVYLSPLEVSVTEGNVGDDISVRIYVCRQPSTLTTTVPVVTSQDSAAASSDFVHINTAVTISIGQVCTPVDITILYDMPIGPTEVFHLAIITTQLPSSVYVVPGHGIATVNIIDNGDTQRPVISNCPLDISRIIARGSSTSASWVPPTASDNTGDVTLTSSHQPGDTFSQGSTTVTYTAMDVAGNTEQCQFVITVIIDNTPPIISGCPSNIVFGAVSQDDDSVPISWTEPTATDDISEPELFLRTRRPGDQFSIGSTTVIYYVRDAAGNIAGCSFQVSVVQIILQCPGTIMVDAGNSVSFNNPTCLQTTNMNVSSSSCVPADGSTISSDTQVSCFCDNYTNVQCSFQVFVTGLPITIQCPNPMMVTFGSPLQYATPSCNTNGNLGSSVNCSHPSGFTLTDDIDVTCTCNSYQAYSCSFHVSVTGPPTTKPVTTTEVTTASTSSTPVTTTQGRTSSTPSISTIPSTPPPGPVTVSGPCAEYLDYRNANSETVFELVLPEDLELVTETIINSNQCPDLLPAMCSLFYPPLPSSGYTLCQETYSQLFEDCQIAFALLAGAMPESCSKFPPRNEAGNMMCIGASEPRSSPVYLVALVIPVLLIIILLVVLFKRIRRKPASESKPVDVQDVDYVNAGATDDPEDYIALEEQSINTPAPKYQDLTEREAPAHVSGYERTILETADAAPKAMPRQGIKRQTDYQYEDANLGETDASKLPSVPQPDLQSEDDTEYEVPDMFEEYTGVYIDNLGASKPITPRPMKIIEYKTFMGRERSKVISEIVQQYTALKTGQQHPWTAAVKLQNKSKNFFKALLPYDHSRVRLDTDGSDIRSDYINASYIKNHQGKVSFIAAQGPREGTKEDFWRMVWKEDVETIVMLVDKDETEQYSKDARYWPNKVNTSQKYAAITVLLMETTAFRSYILREMNVIKGNERVHTVRQYEILCWKYGGVPSDSADLISVIKQIKNQQKGGKHLLVHCSNGVGATGAFIGLYDLMDVIKTKKEVSVFDVIEGMRKDRVNMVLTKLQYLFIFDALLEAMLSPDSQMSCDQLKKLDLSAMKAKCKKEFQILQKNTKHQEDLATLVGNSSENNHKNRFPDLLPVDKFRPVLKSPGNLFGSNDYINATFAKDISQRGFIMTQTPLSSTIEDIWRLVFDYNCTSIVMLNTIDDSDESLTVYWPNGHNVAASYGLMTVICKKIDESDVFTRRQFEVKHKRSQKSLLVDHFSFHGWSGNKPDVHKLREFIKYTRTKGTGPALVHCINGVGLSAVYVTVISELERIEKEGAVDVFRTLHRLRKQCPHAVQTQDEYLLCYEHLRDHLNNPDEYTVVF